MANLRKLLKEIADKNPELKKMNEEGDSFKEKRKQFHLSNGCDEATAIQKSWNDYWAKVKEEYGVEFSVANVSEEEN